MRATPRLAAFTLTALMGVGLVGCSGGSSGAGSPAGGAAGAVASGATGPCDIAPLAQHAGLAAGAVHALVWTPFRKGDFVAIIPKPVESPAPAPAPSPTAKGHGKSASPQAKAASAKPKPSVVATAAPVLTDSQKAAVQSATQASALAAGELSAIANVQGCAAGTALVSAIQAGSSLATAVRDQFKAGKLNTESLGGLNSAVTLVVSQAAAAGANVKEQVPTAAQLAAAH